MLHADNTIPPGASLALEQWPAQNEALWGIEQNAAIAGNAETSGVRAVIEARELLKSRPPQVQIDFFNKALFDVKNRTVQRQIRMTLSQLYKEHGQDDRAMDQLQQLMMDQ
jgi:hypothetical protein